MPPLVGDIALAVALFVIPVIEIHQGRGPLDTESLTVPTLIMAAQAAVLILRRRHPVAVWAASGALVAVYGLSTYPDPTLQYAALVAIYTVAVATSPRTAGRAGVVTLVVMFASLAADTRADVADWLVSTLSVSCAWLFGTAMRTSRAYAAEQRDHAADAARRAVADERLRLARELHDVAAHHVSVIALHAEAGEAMLPASPERAAEAFRTIAGSARSTMTELRRVLGVLRASEAGPDGAPRSPLPTLDELPALAREVTGAGVPVALTVEGTHRPVAVGVETSAYRIVQEALTNVLRHAGPATASVRVRYEPNALDIEVLDDGAGAGPPRAGGHGLIGMGERVASLGGTFSAARRPEGGFAVSARLPA